MAATRLAEDVAAKKCDRGVLICGTGIGVSIAANKVRGAYAALVSNIYQAQRAQLSNDANILAMGAQVTLFNRMDAGQVIGVDAVVAWEE